MTYMCAYKLPDIILVALLAYSSIFIHQIRNICINLYNIDNIHILTPTTTWFFLRVQVCIYIMYSHVNLYSELVRALLTNTLTYAIT